ncbi:MAG: bifunctional NADH-specific enoyl-ACP reductase/trans-2-enoyl-CoA reductase, partial [Porticoccaceae bacterium]
STLKPVGKNVTMRGINTDKEEIQEFSLEAATEQEINDTVAVMGGEDWHMWMEALDQAGVLAEGAKTTAFTYIGEKITWDLYWDGTIGQAKKDLDTKVLSIREKLASSGGDARVSVLKAVVTQASSAIPIMPLYLAMLFREMKANGTHEGCIEQLYRLFTECLYSDNPRTDEVGRLRVDELEMSPEVQASVAESWSNISTENLAELTDFKGYKEEFLKLFGFEMDGVDYDADVNPEVTINNLIN